MNGETVERRVRFKAAWLFWLLLAIGLFLADLFMKHHHLLMLAVAPLAVAVACGVVRRRPFVVSFTDDGIEVQAPTEQFIPYRRVEAVCADRHDPGYRTASFAFELVYRGGILSFPAKLTASSRDMFNFLRAGLDDEYPISPPAELLPYRSHCDREFGLDHVRDYRCLPDPPFERNWFGLALSAAAVFTGVIWLILADEFPGCGDWTGVGGLVLACGAIAFLIWAVASAPKNNGHRFSDGGLVITPVGFALKNGTLHGQMRWDEVTDIDFRRERRQIRITFDGGQVLLRDVFDARLRRIYYRLIDTWEGLLKPAEADAASPEMPIQEDNQRNDSPLNWN